MTEKIGQIKNPLTIIAIFAGIAEVSGTLVLPFINEANQEMFIYFLIGFPTILIILFFLTLNFNNKVLYAPSDYTDEMNYIKINKYDLTQQKNVQVKVLKEKAPNIEITKLSEKFDHLSTQVFKVISATQKTVDEKKIVTKQLNEITNETLNETIGYTFLISNFINAGSFVSYMLKLGIDFEIYLSPGEDNSDIQFADHQSIWLGNSVPLDISKLIIKNAKRFYPHLKYIYVDRTFDDITSVYIGGSTKTATERFNLRPLENSDFNQLETFKSIQDFHNFIESFLR